MVLGTLRVAWDSLEVFPIISDLGTWTLASSSHVTKFGEAGRLCMHPLLDLLSSSAFSDVSDYGSHYKMKAYRTTMNRDDTITRKAGQIFLLYRVVKSARIS